MFLSFLSIIGVWSMLAHVVLFDKQRIHGEVRIHRESYERHLGTLLHHLGIIDGIVGRGSPREWTVILDQHGRRMVRVDFTDVQNLVDDDIASLQY